MTMVSQMGKDQFGYRKRYSMKFSIFSKKKEEVPEQRVWHSHDYNTQKYDENIANLDRESVHHQV